MKGLPIIIGGNHHNTLGVIRALGYKGIRSLVILVTNEEHPYVAYSKYIDKCVLLKTKEGIVPYLLSQAKSDHGKQVILSCADFVTSELDACLNELNEYYYLPTAKGQGICNHYMDKHCMTELAKEVGIAIPKSWIVDTNERFNIQEISFPCIVKPLVSIYGSKSEIKVLKDSISLANYLSSYRGHRFIIQEFINSGTPYPAQDAITIVKKANKYDEAISILEQLEADYSEQINECKYEKAEKLMAEGNYGDAIIAYNDVGNYKDSKQKKNECTYIRACEMEDNGDKKSANELFYDIKDYKDSYKRYIRNSVDIGYIVCKTKYEFNYKNDLTNECTSEELAYKVLKLNEYAKPESIKLYILIIENGKEHRFGNIVISGTYPEKTIGEYTFGIDSEFYAFENKDDYNNNLYENAVFHETLTCNETTTAIRDGISINAGFCTYDSDETNIKDQTSYSWMKGQGTYGYKVHGKPYIKVDGLNENEEISLYMSIVLYPLDGSPIIRMEEGETIITYGNNCIIEDIAPDWKNGVVNVGYSGDIRLYVFSDYISYINQDYENAVAMGEIKYSE